MKRLKHYWFISLFLISYLIFMCNPGLADDTCVFSVTADDVPPNIIILFDNGAEMEQVTWHSGFNNYTDWTPNVAEESRVDVDVNPEVAANVNGFFNENGYAIVDHGGDKYLIKVKDDLTLEGYGDGLKETGAIGAGEWTINGRTITLPCVAATVEIDGAIDNAAQLRYSKNYLNWLFFGTGDGSYPDVSAVDDGSDLSPRSRWYHAKKALISVLKMTENKAKFSIHYYTNDEGAAQKQPLKFPLLEPLAAVPANNTLTAEFKNNINGMATATYSPLAEGLGTCGGYYASPSSGVVAEYCQKLFIIVISPGYSSMDEGGSMKDAQDSPGSLSDYDGDGGAGGIGEGMIKADSTTYSIPVNYSGTTYLDDAAHYLYTNDIVDYQDGHQNVMTYTIGFMGDAISNLFLINTSNNGNGNVNLYDTTDPEYGKYHFTAESLDSLSSVLLEAISDILSRTSTFTAPVVPVTRTTSGNKIYMAFFTPGDANFWEGNVTKFGLSDDSVIMDADDPPKAATWDNGALKEDAIPYWQTKDWADSISYSDRNIYTYLGSSANLTDETNKFKSTNLTAAILGNPTHTIAEIIDYIRGRDVFDEDDNGETNENRAIITGDVLHSEPLIVYYNSTTAVVYFGANDGMLHAASDSDGTELWAFIPPDQLPRLKDIVEDSGHQYFVDSSPKAFIINDNDDGVIGAGEQVILVCGQRGGGTSYFALDVTNPSNPSLLWIIDPSQADFAELGETWSEPQFGVVETTAEPDGVDVFFIGGGYSSNNTAGKAVFAVEVSTGALVKKFNTGMAYSFPSSVGLIDADTNGFVDKVYVGDHGGQMWRFGKFTDADGPLTFPNSDENIDNWTGQIIFDSTNARKFFYPPSVALEKEYDLIFVGTGDREDACNTTSSDRIYSVKDTHASTTLTEADLVDVTIEDPATPLPDIPGGDNGWYIQLATTGERVLAEGTLFYKTFYIPTFTPNNDPCLPGGVGKIYALNYLTGEAVLDFGGSELTRSHEIGGGIPSKPVTIITEQGQKLLISVGSTNPEAGSEEVGAGIVTIEPLAPPANLFYLWWIEL